MGPDSLSEVVVYSDNHLRGVGEVTANFAQLELITASWIDKLLNSEYGQIVAGELSFRRMRALLASLIGERVGNPHAGRGVLATAVETGESRDTPQSDRACGLDER